MKCMICKHGSTLKGFTTVTFERDNSTIIFKHVPALVCENCGEKYIEDTTTRELLQKADEIQKSGAVVDIREYNLDAA